MGAFNIVLSILLLAAAVFLIIAILMQSGKSKGVGSAITGGSSETYFGKNKGKSKEKKLALLTTIVAIIFVFLAIVVFVAQEAPDDATPHEHTDITSGSSGSNASTVDSSTVASKTDSPVSNDKK